MVLDQVLVCTKEANLMRDRVPSRSHTLYTPAHTHIPLTFFPFLPTAASARKNHPLCYEVIRWKSDVPLTEGQLRSKRDEFWDTAPAFEGRKEIWDALRAAAVAVEVRDYQLAQAILDGAGISVPNGKYLLTMLVRVVALNSFPPVNFCSVYMCV